MKLRNHLILYAITVCSMVAGTYQSTAQMNPIKYEEFDLPNGLHCILHVDKSAPIAAVIVHYRVGSRDENPKRNGFAHFFEHLMFEGTKDIPRASISKYAEGVGGRLNAYTSFDETVYHMEVPAHEVKLPMWIESQRMRNLIIDKIGVETQRGVVKEERKMSYDNRPYGTWNEKSNKLLFQGGSYAWTPIGSAQHIDSAAIPEFQEFYDRFYQPNNATLVISGDIDTKQIRGFIDTYFGSIPRGKDIVREKFILEPYNGTSRETIEDPKAQLPAMFVSYRGPKMGDVDAYAFQMLNDILASGESSRLYQRLVDKDQVAVQASAFNWDLQYAGRISMIGVAAPGNELSVVEKTMDEEIKRLQAEGVTDEEFVKAKNIAEVRFLYDKKGALDKGMALAKAHTYFGNANLANTEIEKFYKVTKEDLKRVANKYLTLNDRVVLYYVPKAKTDAKSGG